MQEQLVDSIHIKLRRLYGNPEKCSNCTLKGERVRALRRWHWNIQWALLKGKKYEVNIDNFIGLCSKCHRNYDNESHKVRYYNYNKNSGRKSFS